MDNRIIHFYFLALLSWPCSAAPVSGTFTVSEKSPVSVQRGQTAILPCWLTPSQSAEDMEVRWYQGIDGYDTPVLLYKYKAFDYSSQQASYAGRVSLGLKKETSGGLKAGDVSLKLENVTIEDAGQYTCYASSSAAYGSAIISLSVTETGRSPLLSAVRKDDNKVNISCQSDGWYPQPELSWSEGENALRPDNVLFSKTSASFYSVHSWVLVSSPSEVSCSVGLVNEAPKEARMRLENPPSSQEGSSAGWVAFVILLVAVLAVLGAMYFIYFRKKANKSKSGNDATDGAELNSSPEENEPLLSKEWHPAVFLEASKYYENIQLVDTGNELIRIKNSILRENIHAKFPDGDRVTCLTAVRGSPGFSSGRHYWEVCLQMSANIDLKKSWWIGVTDKHEIPHDESFPPTTKNGFWFLSSCPNRENTVQFSTKPETFIYVQSKPKTVGVYLDFDNRELSFYNVEEKRLIGSLAAKFTGKMFPLFNPGKGEQSSMKIIPLQDQSNNTGPVEKLQNVEEDQSGKTENAEEKIKSGTNEEREEEEGGRDALCNVVMHAEKSKVK